MVGRQALASPLMGEIQIGLLYDPAQGGLIVDVLRAKNLVVKQGAKINPGEFINKLAFLINR